MLRSRLGQCPRFSYVRPQVQAARRDLTLPIATRYPNGRLSYSTQPTRGLFSAKKEMEDASPEDRWNLQHAIEQGDRIGHTRIQSTTHRRALIIAPVYKDHAAARTPGIKWMPTTTRDALLMHSTLTARGYDRANIRILSDGDNYGSASYPTRENIMESLKWLVASAKPGDYRFFHFSGHGVRRGSEKGKGKESRKVNEGQKPSYGDTERRLVAGISPKSRLSSQRINAKELVYYNEALVAQMSSGIHGEETQGPPYLIYDSELNAHFAKLQPGSKLTCVIDSCASARILNNNIKLAGGGFRGAESSGVEDTISWGLRSARGWLDTVKGAVGLDEKIDMKEELPEEEWKRDTIKAKMLTWGACHQRQDSVNYSDLRTGLFTRVWLEALQKDTDGTPLKVGELFDTVSKETMEKAKGESNYWQYVQLWTSSVDGTISAQLQDEILKERVDI